MKSENKKGELCKNQNKMEDKQIKEQILAAISHELDQWFASKAQIKDGMEYEEKIIGMVQRMGNTIISKGEGALPKSRNKKNSERVLEK